MEKQNMEQTLHLNSSYLFVNQLFSTQIVPKNLTVVSHNPTWFIQNLFKIQIWKRNKEIRYLEMGL